MIKIKSLREPLDFYGKEWIVKTISKEDIKENSLLSDYYKYLDEFTTDENMAMIAEKMSDALQDCYWSVLESIIYDMAREKKENLTK